MQIGFVLVLVHCLSSNMNCETKPVDEGKIYSTQSECEWEKQKKSAYYGENLECARVERGN